MYSTSLDVHMESTTSRGDELLRCINMYGFEENVPDMTEFCGLHVLQTEEELAKICDISSTFSDTSFGMTKSNIMPEKLFYIKSESENRTESETRTGSEMTDKTESETRTGRESRTESETRTGRENRTESETRTGSEMSCKKESEMSCKTENETRTGRESRTESETRSGVSLAIISNPCVNSITVKTETEVKDGRAEPSSHIKIEPLEAEDVKPLCESYVSGQHDLAHNEACISSVGRGTMSSLRRGKNSARITGLFSSHQLRLLASIESHKLESEGMNERGPGVFASVTSQICERTETKSASVYASSGHCEIKQEPLDSVMEDSLQNTITRADMCTIFNQNLDASNLCLIEIPVTVAHVNQSESETSMKISHVNQNESESCSRNSCERNESEKYTVKHNDFSKTNTTIVHCNKRNTKVGNMQTRKRRASQDLWVQMETVHVGKRRQLSKGGDHFVNIDGCTSFEGNKQNNGVNVEAAPSKTSSKTKGPHKSKRKTKGSGNHGNGKKKSTGCQGSDSPWIEMAQQPLTSNSDKPSESGSQSKPHGDMDMTTDSPPGPRGSYHGYTIEERKRAVEMVTKQGCSSTSRQLNIPKSTIMSWTKRFAARHFVYKKNPGQPELFPKEEQELCAWVLKMREQHIAITRQDIKKQALKIIKSPNFVASNGWVGRFMQRKKPYLQFCGEKQQQLTDDLKQELQTFRAHLQQVLSKTKPKPDHIIAMDEIPVCLSIGTMRSLLPNSSYGDALRIASSQKSPVVVLIAVTASGDTLPPLVILRGKRFPHNTVTLPDGVHVEMNPGGQMTPQIMKTWIGKILKPHTRRQPSLLVMDSFSVHTNSSVDLEMRQCNVTPTVIPSGCASKAQPLEVFITKQFKAYLEGRWESYLRHLIQTPNCKLQKSSRQLLVEWVADGWMEILQQSERIRNTFQVTGLTDGDEVEENLLRANTCSLGISREEEFGNQEENNWTHVTESDSKDEYAPDNQTSCDMTLYKGKDCKETETSSNQNLEIQVKEGNKTLENQASGSQMIENHPKEGKVTTESCIKKDTQTTEYHVNQGKHGKKRKVQLAEKGGVSKKVRRLKYPTVNQDRLGHPTANQNPLGHPTANQNRLEHPTANQNRLGHPTANQNRSGHPSAKQDRSGDPTASQHHILDSTAIQNHLSDTLSVQDHMEDTDAIPDPSKERPEVSTRKGYVVYSIQQKKEAVLLGQKEGFKKAARILKIPTSTLFTWRKRFSSGEFVKTKNPGASAHFPLEERILCDWILEKQEQRYPLKRKEIHDFACKLVNQENFSASAGWLDRFLRRSGLSLQGNVIKSQEHLTKDTLQKIKTFHDQVETIRSEHDFNPACLINMDEIILEFDLTPRKEMSRKDIKEELGRLTGSMRGFVTVMLAISASGKCLPPCVILRGKRHPKGKLPTGVYVAMLPQDFLTQEIMESWIQNVLHPYTEGKPTLLVMDGFSGHTIDKVNLELGKVNVTPVIIPNGCSSKVQPLEVSIHKQFKSYIEQMWATHLNHLCNGKKKGSKVNRKVFLEWVLEAWDDIKKDEDGVLNSFKVTGITGPFSLRETMDVVPEGGESSGCGDVGRERENDSVRNGDERNNFVSNEVEGNNRESNEDERNDNVSNDVERNNSVSNEDEGNNSVSNAVEETTASAMALNETAV